MNHFKLSAIMKTISLALLCVGGSAAAQSSQNVFFTVNASLPLKQEVAISTANLLESEQYCKLLIRTKYFQESEAEAFSLLLRNVKVWAQPGSKTTPDVLAGGKELLEVGVPGVRYGNGEVLNANCTIITAQNRQTLWNDYKNYTYYAQYRTQSDLLFIDPVTSETVKSLPRWAGTIGVRFTSDGQRMASIVSDDVVIEEVPSFKEIARFRRPGTFPWNMGFSHDNRYLVMSLTDWNTQNKAQIVVWDIKSQTVVAEKTIDDQITEAFSVSPTQALLAVRSGKLAESIELLELPSLKTKATIAAMALPWTLRFSNNGEQLAVGGSAPNGVEIYQVSTRAKLAFLAEESAVGFVDYSSDGQKLATGSNTDAGARVRIWDAKQFTKEFTAPLNADSRVWMVTFSPDSSKLMYEIMQASGGFTQVYSIKDQSTLQLDIDSSNGVNYPRFTPYIPQLN